MVTVNTFLELASTLPEIEEQPYREGVSFKFRSKVVATLWPVKDEVFVKATIEQLQLLIEANSDAFFPASNSWGAKGWTGINLKKVKKTQLKQALQHSWENVSGFNDT